MSQSSLSQRHIAALQQMGITPYKLHQPKAKLGLISPTDEPLLSSPLVLDVLRFLNISPEECVQATSVQACAAKRYWCFVAPQQLVINPLYSEHNPKEFTADAKRALWRALQQWQ